MLQLRPGIAKQIQFKEDGPHPLPLTRALSRPIPILSLTPVSLRMEPGGWGLGGDWSPRSLLFSSCGPNPQSTRANSRNSSS